jgi:hypothetical protein
VEIQASDSARHSIIASGAGRSIAYCFLAGAGFQIVVALLYRTAMWYLYMEEEEKATPRWLHRASEWLSYQYLVELVFDLLTLVSFATGTLKVLHAVIP